ncbi:hypothetical protein [Nocardia gipuzkoensis]
MIPPSAVQESVAASRQEIADATRARARRSSVASGLKVVDADTPPSRIFFGTFPLQVVPQVYADRVKGWQEWAELSAAAEAGPA